MRAVYITRHGAPDVLEVRERPNPAPGPGEVRVRVRAAGVNFADVVARLGLYPDAPPPPFVVGYEVSGVVDRVGAGVTRIVEGDRVVAMTRFGGYADVAVVPEAQVLGLPAEKGFSEGAALPVNYVTAYHMLYRTGSLHPGQRVLVHMAAGGVGTAVIQLARLTPDVELFGTASASKHEYLRGLGVHHPIDPRADGYASRVLELTGGEGVDLVLDPLGGRDWRVGYRLLRPAGRLVLYGVANLVTGERRSLLRAAGQLAAMPLFSPVRLMNDNRTVTGVHVGRLLDEMALLAREARELLELWQANKIAPRIDCEVPLERAADAHRRLQARQNLGKVVLVTG